MPSKVDNFLAGSRKYMGYVLDIVKGLEGRTQHGWVSHKEIAKRWGEKYPLPIEYMSWAIHFLIEDGLGKDRLYERNVPSASYTTNPGLATRINLAGRDLADVFRGEIAERKNVQLCQDFVPYEVGKAAFPLVPADLAADFFKRHGGVLGSGWELVRDDRIYDKLKDEYTAGVAGSATLKSFGDVKNAITVTEKNSASRYMVEGDFWRRPHEHMRIPDEAARKGYVERLLNDIVYSWIRLNKKILKAAGGIVENAGSGERLKDALFVLRGYADIYVTENEKASPPEKDKWKPGLKRNRVLEASGVLDLLGKEIETSLLYSGLFRGTKTGRSEVEKMKALVNYMADSAEAIGAAEYRVQP